MEQRRLLFWQLSENEVGYWMEVRRVLWQTVCFYNPLSNLQGFIFSLFVYIFNIIFAATAESAQ